MEGKKRAADNVLTIMSKHARIMKQEAEEEENDKIEDGYCNVCKTFTRGFALNRCDQWWHCPKVICDKCFQRPDCGGWMYEEHKCLLLCPLCWDSFFDKADNIPDLLNLVSNPVANKDLLSHVLANSTEEELVNQTVRLLEDYKSPPSLDEEMNVLRVVGRLSEENRRGRILDLIKSKRSILRIVYGLYGQTE